MAKMGVVHLRGMNAAAKNAILPGTLSSSVISCYLLIDIYVSLADAVTRCFLIATLLIAVGFAATLFLREIPLRKRQKAGEVA